MEYIGPKRTPKRKNNIVHLTTEDLLPWHIACAQYNENGKFCLSCDEVDIDNYSTNYIQIVWDEDGKESPNTTFIMIQRWMKRRGND